MIEIYRKEGERWCLEASFEEGDMLFSNDIITLNGGEYVFKMRHEIRIPESLIIDED